MLQIAKCMENRRKMGSIICMEVCYLQFYFSFFISLWYTKQRSDWIFMCLAK